MGYERGEPWPRAEGWTVCFLTLLGPGPGAADRRSIGEVSLDLLLGSGPGLAPEPPHSVGCQIWVSPKGRGEPSWLVAYGEKMSRGILAPDLSSSDSFMAPPRVSPQRWPFNFLASFNA